MKTRPHTQDVPLRARLLARQIGILPPPRPRPDPSPLRVWLFSWLRWPSTETTEWFCLRSAFWWALTLSPALHLFAANGNFSGLAAFGNEGAWQIVMGVLLLGQVFAVCLGSVWARFAALFAFGTIWAFITGLLWAGAPHAWGWAPVSTGIGPYASLSVDCFAVAIHLVRRWYIDRLAEQERAAIRASLLESGFRAESAAPRENVATPGETGAGDGTAASDERDGGDGGGTGGRGCHLG